MGFPHQEDNIPEQITAHASENAHTGLRELSRAKNRACPDRSSLEDHRLIIQDQASASQTGGTDHNVERFLGKTQNSPREEVLA